MIHRESINAGLWTIDKLYNDHILMDRNMINIVHDIHVDMSQMDYNCIVSEIPQAWKRFMLNINQAKKYVENKNYANIINMLTKLIKKNFHIC